MVALPEQAPGQTTLEEQIETAEAEAQEATQVRQVIVIPGDYILSPAILATEGGEYGELAYGTPVHGGSLYFTRSQLVATGSAMLQLAGKMIPPKDVTKQAAAAEKLAAGGLALPSSAAVTGLVDVAGNAL